MGRKQIPKVSLVPKLFIERVDGTWPLPHYDDLIKKKRLGDYFVYHTMGGHLASIDLIDERFGEDGNGIESNLNNKKLSDYFIKNEVPYNACNTIWRCLKEDNFTRNMCTALISYKKEAKHKNYVMSKNLTECMGDISLDVPKNLLPKQFIAYIQPKGLIDEDDGTKILGAIVCIGDFLGFTEAILINLFTSSSAYGDASLEQLYEYKSLFGNLNTVETLDTFNFNIDYKGDTKISSSRCLRTIINTVLYIHGGNEKFKEQFNEFSTRYKKASVQRGIYSEAKFVRIGYENAEHLKLMVEKGVKVRSHWRSQPYGPQRMYRKPILIAEQNRKYKRYIDKEGTHI